jgi:RNA polymerase sigma-70 factor (ECF subfamily)
MLRPAGFQVEDAELVERVRKSDRAARQMLFDRHAPHVARVLQRVLGQDQDLADLVHDVFVQALRDLERLREVASFRPWITSIAVHVARRHIRKKTRWRWITFFGPEEANETPSATNASEDILEATRLTYALLDRMNTDERLAFSLRYIEGMELAEIAAACDVSLATIKRRLQKAEATFVELARKNPVLQGWVEGGTRWGQ